MVLKRAFQSTTSVFAGCDYIDTLRNLLDGSSYALATSAAWIRQGTVDTLRQALGEPAVVIDGISPNPKVSDVISLGSGFPSVDMVIALGGGSVIDCTKGLVALQALAGNRDALMAHLQTGEPLPEPFLPAPIIAIPTTSGTGAEVTRWATIWGDDKVKYSLSHTNLVPNAAILDPILCVSMPYDVTLSSGLDALSHAMESIWNVHHTPITDEFATTAIRAIAANLPCALTEPDNIEVRSRMQTAAVLSGFAISTTQTAVAHSISYPFTAHYGMPHGLACSFTLPEVARYNAQTNPERVAIIVEAFGGSLDDFPERLAEWFDELDLGTYMAKFVGRDVVNNFGDNLITRARAANNLRSIDGRSAHLIMERSLNRLLPDIS